MNNFLRVKEKKITFTDFNNNDKNTKHKNFNSNSSLHNNNDDINKNNLKLFNSNLTENKQNEINFNKPIRRVKFLKTTKIPFENQLTEKFKITQNLNINNNYNNYYNFNFYNNNDKNNLNSKLQTSNINSTTKNNSILSLKYENFSGRHSYRENHPIDYILTLDENDDSDFYERNINKPFFRRNSFLKHAKEKKYFQAETEEDPLQIPKEDEIFNELAKRKKTIRLTKIKLKIIDNNKNKPKKKKKKIVKGRNFKEQLLNRVYEKNPIANKKMIKIKKSKEKINLDNYQNLLLKTVEPILSKESFHNLDKIFNRLRNDNNDIYEYNFPYIKNIENQEKEIIYNINQISDKYNQYVNKYKTLNEFYNNKTIQLPKINFRRITNKEKFKYLNTME